MLLFRALANNMAPMTNHDECWRITDESPYAFLTEHFSLSSFYSLPRWWLSSLNLTFSICRQRFLDCIKYLTLIPLGCFIWKRQAAETQGIAGHRRWSSVSVHQNNGLCLRVSSSLRWRICCRRGHVAISPFPLRQRDLSTATFRYNKYV